MSKQVWVNVGETTVYLDGAPVAPGDEWAGEPPRFFIRNGSFQPKPKPKPKKAEE